MLLRKYSDTKGNSHRPDLVKIVGVLFRSNEGLYLPKGTIIITESAERFAEFPHGTAVNVTTDKVLFLFLIISEQPLKLHRRDIFGIFFEVSNEEISA